MNTALKTVYISFVLRSTILTVLLLRIASLVYPADEEAQNVRNEAKDGRKGVVNQYNFSWSHWDGRRNVVKAYLNDALIGSGKEAASKLAAMSFPRNSTIQISLPEIPDGGLSGINRNGFVVYSYYNEEDFLWKWILQGVRIQFKINGQEHEIHTLAALDSKNKPIHPTEAGVFNGVGETKGDFLFDGEHHGSVEWAIGAMAKANWADGSIIYICMSKTTVPSPQKPDNGIGSVLRFLSSCKVKVVNLGVPFFLDIK